MTRLSVARIFLSLILIKSVNASAEGASVVDVKRNIQMSETEPTYRDYYINAGTSQGFKKDTLVEAKRKRNIRDSSGTKSIGEIDLPVGTLKVIYANNNMSIAREVKLSDLSNSPVLDQNAIMVGDVIEVKR